MKIDTKKIKIISRWTGVAAGITIVLLLNYVETIVEALRSDSGINTPYVVFLGLGFCSYIVMLIFFFTVDRNIKKGNVFTIKTIRLAQLFGVLHIAAAFVNNIWLDGDRIQINSEIVVGLLVIIVAQMFRQGFKIEKDEDLTV